MSDGVIATGELSKDADNREGIEAETLLSPELRETRFYLKKFIDMVKTPNVMKEAS